MHTYTIDHFGMLGEATTAQKYITILREERLDVNMHNPSTNQKILKVFILIY